MLDHVFEQFLKIEHPFLSDADVPVMSAGRRRGRQARQ
jgi:hypothetical protein